MSIAGLVNSTTLDGDQTGAQNLRQNFLTPIVGRMPFTAVQKQIDPEPANSGQAEINPTATQNPMIVVYDAVCVWLARQFW